MSTEKLVQNSFVNGQYDREVQSKERTDFVGSGVAKALNVVSGEKGELRKRLGTRYLMQIDEPAVLVPFRIPDGDDLILLCTNNRIRGYEFAGNKLLPYYIYSGSTPTFPDAAGWNSNTNGDYTVACDPEKTDQNEWWYTVGVATGTAFTRTTTNSSTYFQIETTNAQLLSSLVVSWNKFEGNYGYEGWLNPVLQYSDDGSVWESVNTDCINTNTNQSGIYQYTVTSSGMIPFKDYFTEYKVVNVNHSVPHKYWRVLMMTQIVQNQPVDAGRNLLLRIKNVLYASTTNPVHFDITTNFSSDILKNIKYSQEKETMTIAAGGVKPLELTYSPSGISHTVVTAVDNWGTPKSVVYFQNRLWFAGFANLQNTAIASKFDDYDNFTEQNPVQFDDYLNLKCNQLKSSIKNIVGSQNVLYCFSEDGVAFVDGGSQGMLATNQSIEFNLKNRMPAGNATPAFKDDVMLYVSADGKNLYAVDYNLMVSRFEVDDLAKYAKSITSEKINELHYVNNSAKLVYGLLDNGDMFALNYQKGQYQGFFPMKMTGGYVYDIVSVKSNGDYKLLLVVNRGGMWCIEEISENRNFVNTNFPTMTKEDKKWATYDNLENNIALDCYQEYDKSFSAIVTIEDNEAITTADLSAYIGKSVMFGLLNDSKNWVIADIDSVSDNGYNITVIATRGSNNNFDTVYPGFSEFVPNLPNTKNIGVVAQGQYFEELTVDGNRIELDDTVYKLIYGVVYDAYAYLEVQRPYESMKSVKQIDLQVQDTMHLSVGTGLNDMQVLEDINDNTHYDLTNMTMNGSYVIVPSDTPEWEKYIILKSDKGLPFTVNAVEVIMNYSNEGGN